MTVGCIIIPHFPLRITLLEQPELDGLPLVLTSPPSTRTVVADCTPEALERGVCPGMPLREVTALCPEAMFIVPNPVRESVVFERLLQQVETFSPHVEPGEPGICYVDLHGLSRQAPSAAIAARQLLSFVPAVLRPRAGVATGKFAAWAAARQAPPGHFKTIAPSETREFLQTFPITALPVAVDLRQRMQRLGLFTLRDVARLPVAAVQARFGPEGRRVWELAQGRDETIIRPRERLETIVERLDLPAPTTSRETLLIGLKQAIQRGFRHPALRHRHVRQIRLQIVIEDHRSWTRDLTFREPAGVERAVEIVGHRLQSLELSGPAEAVIVELIGLAPHTAHQEFLPGLKPRYLQPIAHAAHQLKQRYGSVPLYRIVEVEPWSRIPERRHAMVTFDP